MSHPRNLEDPRLREHRASRMMTQLEVAERLEQLAWVIYKRRVGVNADMVSKWERGEKRPSRFYVRLLCTLYEVSPASLGLGGTPARTSGANRPQVPGPQQPVAELLEDMHAPVELLRPRLISLWRQELLTRRNLLKSLGVVPAAVGLEALDGPLSLLAEPEPPRFQGGTTVGQLEQLATDLESIYHSVDPHQLVMPLQALVETAESYVERAPRSGIREALLAVVARGHLLAGRLAFFDLRRPMQARAHLDVAREAASEANEPHLAAAALGHTAFIPADQHRFSVAASYLNGAGEELSKDELVAMRAWLAAVEAELSANAGQLVRALAHVDAAREHLSMGDDEARPPWFDFFDERRLNGFAGYVQRRAGDHAAARTALEDAVRPDFHTGPKQRAVSQIDLGVVLVELGDIDQGCSLATDAALALQQAGYAMAMDRLAEFRTALPDDGHPAARLLEEVAASLA